MHLREALGSLEPSAPTLLRGTVFRKAICNRLVTNSAALLQVLLQSLCYPLLLPSWDSLLLSLWFSSTTIRSSAHSPRLGSLLATGGSHLIPQLPSSISGPSLGPASAPHLQLSTGHFLWMKHCRRKLSVSETRYIRHPCPSPGSTFVNGTPVNYHTSFSSAPVFKA